MKELMQELVEAMVKSATDELGNGYPEWGWRWDDTVEITTQQSRNPSRSRNGGEYFGFTFFEIRPDGVEVWEGSSCELVSRAEEKARSVRGYPISLSKEGLERMAHLAEARALQQVAPDEALDPKVAFVIKAATMLISKEIGFREFKEAVRASEAQHPRNWGPAVQAYEDKRPYPLLSTHKGRSRQERKEALQDFIELAETIIEPEKDFKLESSRASWLKSLVSAKDAVEGW